MTERTHAGRTVLVTGASSGVGAHLARLLAQAGARVVMGARRVERLDALVAEMQAAGGEALSVSLDVADPASVAAAYDAAEARFGGVDTIIANAGIAKLAPALEFSLEDFDETLRINLRGVFLVAQEGARRLAATKTPGGRILIISSIGAHTVLPNLAAYSASKAGAAMMGRSLAADWARHGITVNTLCPGYMLTEMNAAWFQGEGGARQIAQFPRRRLMPIAALDPAVLYLSSDAGEYTTGAVLTIDDGQSI